MTYEIKESEGIEKRAMYYGILLLLAFTLTFELIPFLTMDGIARYLSVSIYGIFKLGLIFYGQSSVKKLNRNYGFWSAALFLCTSISLIIIGQLSKLHKESTILKFEISESDINPNDFPSLMLSTNSNMLIEALQNDSFTLHHMLLKQKEYIKDNSLLFPIAAAYQLNSRGEKLNPETVKSLDNYAKNLGLESFDVLTSEFTKLSPGEINEKYIERNDLN